MAKTIIDELVVTLGLDPKKFGTGAMEAQARLEKFDKTVKALGVDESKLNDQHKAAVARLRAVAVQGERTSKQLESTQAAGTALYGALEKGALAFGAAIGVYGLGQLAKDAVVTNANLARLAPTVGLAADKLDAYGKAVREATGGDGANIQGVLGGLNAARAGIAVGQIPSQLIQALQYLNRFNGGKLITPYDANGQPLAPDELLLQMADPIKRAGLANAGPILSGLLGADESTLGALALGRSGFEKYLAQAQQSTLTQPQYDDAKKVEAAASTLEDSFKKLSSVITLTVAPVMSGIFTTAAAWVAFLRGDITAAQRDAQIRAGEAAAYGSQFLVDKDAAAALAIVDAGDGRRAMQNRAKALLGKTSGAVVGTDEQRLARLKQIIASGETPQSAAAILLAEEAAGRAPGAQTTVQPIGGAPTASSDLVKRVIAAESNGRVNAMSSAGAQGLMQLLPSTFANMRKEDPTIGPNILDPKSNIAAGTRYLLEQLATFGTVEKALAAYNMGPSALNSAILRFGDDWRSHFPGVNSYINTIMGSGASGGSSTVIHQTGDVNINVANGTPSNIAAGWHQAVVNQANSGPR